MGFTHFDQNGKAVMVDVTSKDETVREATATGKIIVNTEVFQAIKAGTVGKGDVLGVAATAGIMGAKRTSDLIPMCHILPITNCRVNFEMDKSMEISEIYLVKKTGGKSGNVHNDLHGRRSGSGDGSADTRRKEIDIL